MKRRTKKPIKVTCDDCGVDITKIGEYVMLNPSIWKDELGLGWDDNLCLGCVEKRLGRRLKGVGDVISLQAQVAPPSLRLLVRLHGAAITKRKPYRFYASIKGSIGGFSAKDIAKIGAARDGGL